MRKKQILPWALVILLAVLQTGMTVSADETTIENTTPVENGAESAASAEGEQAGTTPAEEKTPEQIAEEERAKLEAEKQASLESQADTNLLQGGRRTGSVCTFGRSHGYEKRCDPLCKEIG